MDTPWEGVREEGVHNKCASSATATKVQGYTPSQPTPSPMGKRRSERERLFSALRSCVSIVMFFGCR